jgi:hypothetical protein
VILPQPPPYIRSPEHLKAWLQEIGVGRTDWMAFVFQEGGNAVDRHWTWLVTRTRADYTFFLGRTFVLRSPEHNVRIPGMEGLSEKRFRCWAAAASALRSPSP